MTIHSSPFPPLVIPDQSITDCVFAGLARRGDAAALTCGVTGQVITASSLMDQVRRLAGGLVAAGFGKGRVIALMAPNMPDYAVVFHGIAYAGGTLTTINPTYTAPEVRHQLLDSRASLLITIPAFLATATEAAAGTGVTEIVVLGAADGHRSLSALMGDPLAAQVPVDPDRDVVVLPYSSGTTGLPKGVMLSHRNLVANVLQCAQARGLGAGQTTLAVLPFFHIYGMQVMMNMYLACGSALVTLPRFDLETALRLIQDHRMENLYFVPPIVLALAKHPLVDQFDFSALRSIFSGAAPMGAELSEAAAARLDCAVVQGFGMTELSPVSHMTPVGANRPGAVGVAVANTACRIIDPDTGLDRADGAEGELLIRGPQVMLGYLNNPEATAHTLDADGWLHTGDLGRIDADGYLFIVDRVKELIKVKGFQVAPAELEALIIAHPQVADVAVIGQPDDEAGEVPVAFVVRKPGSDLTAEQVMAALAGQVASYKLLRRVTFVDAIPKSASGKILRRVLRAQLQG